MSRILVVSQPMFLPWIGLFEQIRLADVFVHYDDVQIPQGRSFITRVQIKSAGEVRWLSAPIDHGRSGKLINEVYFFSREDWRRKHLATLRHAYARAPYFKLMFELAERIFHCASDQLAEFNISAIEQIAHWLGLTPQFLRSSRLEVQGASTQRLVDLCDQLECNIYVTGHGALKYLDHRRFEENGVDVRYMDYKKVSYSQVNEFTPYVSILDAIANCGERTRGLLCSNAIHWREFRKRMIR